MDPAREDDGLRGALAASLENRGAARAIKAKIRAEVFASLNNDAVAPTRALPADVYLAGEILKDFLVRMKCENTLSVLTQELGLNSQESLEREFLLQELGMQGSAKEADVPVLMLMMQQQMEKAAVETTVPAAGSDTDPSTASS
jgi:hypothetical protein